jgi:8-oxo-dGTP diphosphatase
VHAAGLATPTVAVDVALFTVRAGALNVLLVPVRHGPFTGQWALPGGRVGVEETLDAAAHRYVALATGHADAYLEQLYTFGSPQRDPQSRVVSVAYFGLAATGTGGGEEAPGAFHRVRRLPALAYDHGAVLKTALARLRSKLGYTNLVYTLLPRAFTLGELQEMYEAILGRRLDRRNFRKKVRALGLLRPLARVRRGPHRPAALYSFRHRRPMVVEIL